MNNWRFRRRTFPLIRREAHSRVEAIPIANIDMLLRSIIDVMNEIALLTEAEILQVGIEIPRI